MKTSSLCLIACIAIALNANAQSFKYGSQDEDDDIYEHKTYFMAGINYLSNNVYLGRKDTIVIPYTSPYIGFHFDNGIYAKGMVSYTSAGTNGGHIDLTTLEAGYDHSFGEHFNAGLNAERFFYNKNSVSVRANTIACIGADAQYSNKWIEPSVIFDINLNKNTTDYVLGTALDHDFNLVDGKLDIIPTVTTFIGTQNYYDEYFTNRINKRDKTVKVKHVVADATKFNVMDYEFSIKSTYRANHWLFTLIPTYAIPLSPAIITLPNKIQREKLSNSFYLELDICYRS